MTAKHSRPQAAMPTACPEKGSTDLQGIIGQVAGLLLGEPNASLSKPTELRFGSHGSLAVDLDKGTWFSHEENVGGGTLDLIAREAGIASRADQLAWLEQKGLKEKKPTPSPKCPKSQKPKIDTTYAYKDEKGRRLFEVVRFEPKDFRQRKPDGKGGWIWSVKDVRQVPYHLPQLLAADPNQPVFIVEGEKDVLRLESLGLVATCNAGGAGKWPDELSEHFENRRVVILPDNDEPGHKHADKVATALDSVTGGQVRVLCLPGLPPKGDVSDWLDAGGTVEQLLELVDAPGNGLPEDDAPVEEHFEPGDEDDEKQSQASLLVKFVDDRFELFHDMNKEVFVTDRKTGEVRALASRQFRDCLLAGFYKETGKAPRDQSIREAIGTLAGLGRFDGEQRPVNLRFAGERGEYWIDLAIAGDSRAVRLRPGHWEVVERAPVAFVRPESMQPLPLPIPGGSLDALWEVCNVPAGNRLLVLAWLVECLRPETPFPVLEILGEHGSAKSSVQKYLRRLIDPNACDLRSAPKSVEDVFVSAGAAALVSLENVSHLSAPLQDALCVLATGGGFAKRKLYSDTEESVIQVKRPIILNGISACVTAQDLVDRAITVEPPVITGRRKIADLDDLYEQSLPALLGALLDLAAKALAILPDMDLPADQRPRMIEFALLGMAVAKAAGKHPDDFLAEFSASRQEGLARTLDASPVAAAVVELIEERPQGMTAPAKEILLTLERYRPTGCDSWPRSAKGLGDALRRAAPALRQLGIDCKCLGKGSGGVVRWEVRRKVVVSKSQMSQVPNPPAEKLGHGTSGTLKQELSPATDAAEYF